MTDFYEGYDKVLFQERNAYLSQWLRGQYVEAAHRLYILNCSLIDPVADMPEFAFIRRGNRGDVKEQAYVYCKKWEPQIAMQGRITRQEETDKFKDDGF